MRYWLDLEFLENGYAPIHLLSIALVAEDGREYYAINRECPVSTEANAFVQAQVLPYIEADLQEDPALARSRAQIAAEIRSFVAQGRGVPEFWGYFSAYDWVVLCQLFGNMTDLPAGWPMYCRDIEQWAADLGQPRLPAQVSGKHRALDDALWTKRAWIYLAACEREATQR